MRGLNDVLDFGGDSCDLGPCPGAQVRRKAGEEHFAVGHAFDHDRPEYRQTLPGKLLIGKVGNAGAERGHLGEQEPVRDGSPLLFRDVLDVGHDNERLAEIGLRGLGRNDDEIGAGYRLEYSRFPRAGKVDQNVVKCLLRCNVANDGCKAIALYGLDGES